MLSPDFKEFIALLNKNDVRYLVVGGYAVAAHGHPRYTKDLDVWLEISSDNADRVLQALDQFGFGALDLGKKDFLCEGQIIQLGYPPNRIDLITSATGLRFEDCYTAKVQVILDGEPINFIDLENLKRNKRATGRFQDLADLEKLEG
ncbi:MAG: hypothetical protein ABIL58_08605 [Pseudomonadota bacterium]